MFMTVRQNIRYMASTAISRINAVLVFPVPEIALKQIRAGVVSIYAAQRTRSDATDPCMRSGMSVYMLITVSGNIQNMTRRADTGI